MSYTTATTHTMIVKLSHKVVVSLRTSTLVWSNRLSHVFTRNLGSTEQTTYIMSCLVSRLVDLYNFLICAHKKEYYELHGNNNSYNGCGVVS
jgi:hypothetical protein